MDKRDKDVFRFDFEEEIVSVDKDTGEYRVAVRPNHERYEWREKDGKRELFDKFDKLVFPEALIYQMLEEALKSVPNSPEPQLINSAIEYYELRSPIVRQFLKIKSIPTEISDKSEAFLESLQADKLNFVIVSIDIVGSTQLAISLNAKEYSFAISIILHEISHLIPKFHGHVLKYTGDGLIAYFSEPSFITKNDLALDCALTIRGLIMNVINPEFKIQLYPEINVRIGIDSGEACIEVIGSAETKQHKDIIGAVVSLAAKIQNIAEPGKIYIGETVERNLHTMWRKNCRNVDITAKLWKYKHADGEFYKIFDVDIE